VDGIPVYIKHGYNGLLFESENVADLADKMKTMIKDTNYAEQLAENGHHYVNKYLSEEHYLLSVTRMINNVIEQKQDE
jgi:glycosyltransferase involved in cell wall biosynthesis